MEQGNHLIRELRSHIQTLQSEVYILGEELKEKSVRSLIITNNNQRNKTSDQIPKNPTTIFPSKENNSDNKEYVSPIEDEVTDFCIDDTGIKRDATEKNKVVSSIKNQFKQKALAESNTEREEHEIAIEDTSEIVSFQTVLSYTDTAQKMMFSIKDFFRKCDQFRSFLRIWSHLLKKSLTENFIFCAV